MGRLVRGATLTHMPSLSGRKTAMSLEGEAGAEREAETDDRWGNSTSSNSSWGNSTTSAAASIYSPSAVSVASRGQLEVVLHLAGWQGATSAAAGP